MRRSRLLALPVAAVLLIACGRTAIVIVVDALSFIPPGDRAFATAALPVRDFRLGPFDLNASGDLIGLVGAASGELAVALDITPSDATTLAMRVYLAPAGALDPFGPGYLLGRSPEVAAGPGVRVSLALTAALGQVQLDLLRAGRVRVGVEFEASALAATASGELTLARLTVRRDPPAP